MPAVHQEHGFHTWTQHRMREQIFDMFVWKQYQTINNTIKIALLGVLGSMTLTCPWHQWWLLSLRQNRTYVCTTSQIHVVTLHHIQKQPFAVKYQSCKIQDFKSSKYNFKISKSLVHVVAQMFKMWDPQIYNKIIVSKRILDFLLFLKVFLQSIRGPKVQIWSKFWNSQKGQTTYWKFIPKH